MGVSIEVWRARVGMFGSDRHSRKSLIGQVLVPSLSKSLSSVLTLLIIIVMLLVASGIEENPGPTQFTCFFCKQIFSSAKACFLHQVVHSSGKNFKFPCFIESCSEKFGTLNAFRIHFRRIHQQATSLAMSPGGVGCITRCNLISCQQTLNSRKELMVHMAYHIMKGFVITCPFKNCSKSFSKKNAFRVHVSLTHRDEGAPPPSPPATAPLPTTIAPPPTTTPTPFPYDNDSGDEVLQDLNIDEDIYPEHLVKDQIAKFYLRMEGSLLLAASTVQTISEEIGLLSRMSHHCLKRALSAELKMADLDQVCIEGILRRSFKHDPIFNVHHKNEDADDMSTTHLRTKYMKRHLPFVQPVSIKLGHDNVGNLKMAHYVPLKESLACLLRDESVKELVEKSFLPKQQAGDDGVFEDFTNGTAYKQHRNTCGERCLVLNFFQDAFEFNPFGPGKNLYKCTGFYFTLANLPPEYRSKVDMIQLNYIITEQDLKRFGHEECLKPLIEELTELKKSGISFSGRQVPVCLLFFIGDNLGSNQIGGFVESFRSEHCCRYCEMPQSAWCDEPHKCQPLRTPEQYDQCASKMSVLVRAQNRQKQMDIQRKRSRMVGAARSRAPQKRNHRSQAASAKTRRTPVSNVKGIKYASVLNSVPGFHVSSPALPPCLAHDLFQGVICSVLALILKHFIKDKRWFDLEILNRRIKSFKCKGSDRPDAPTPVKETLRDFKKISGHACENWTLLRLLPFIISDLVIDKEDTMWKLYLLLKEICECVCAPKISIEQVAYLRILIERFLFIVKEQFPDSIIPKMHFLCHYPDLIMTFGPLIRLWTMRYESKHVFFKSVAIACKNFKNITYTLSKKYQQRFTYDHTGQLPPPDVQYDANAAENICYNSLSDLLHAAIVKKGVPSSALKLRSVNIKGIVYEPELWLVMKAAGVVDLEVGCIKIIISVSPKEVLFVVDKHTAVNTFNGYYSIVDTVVSPNVCIQRLDEFPDYYPLPSYQMDGKRCLSLKHSVLCR